MACKQLIHSTIIHPRQASRKMCFRLHQSRKNGWSCWTASRRLRDARAEDGARYLLCALAAEEHGPKSTNFALHACYGICQRNVEASADDKLLRHVEWVAMDHAGHGSSRSMPDSGTWEDWTQADIGSVLDDLKLDQGRPVVPLATPWAGLPLQTMRWPIRDMGTRVADRAAALLVAPNDSRKCSYSRAYVVWGRDELPRCHAEKAKGSLALCRRGACVDAESLPEV